MAVWRKLLGVHDRSGGPIMEFLSIYSSSPEYESTLRLPQLIGRRYLGAVSTAIWPCQRLRMLGSLDPMTVLDQGWWRQPEVSHPRRRKRLIVAIDDPHLELILNYKDRNRELRTLPNNQLPQGRIRHHPPATTPNYSVQKVARSSLLILALGKIRPSDVKPGC